MIIVNFRTGLSAFLGNAKYFFIKYFSFAFLYKFLKRLRQFINTINKKTFKPLLRHFFNFSFFKKTISVIISLTIIFSGISNVLAGEIASSQYDPHRPLNNINDNPINHIVIDNSRGRGELSLDRAQNGTPIIHINNVSAAGVSVNYYKEFNVNYENLIINNYKGDATNTNLAGAIYGNPNFNKAGGREADIILNEVLSNKRTYIEGYIEIAGKRADLIIANPNGISVSGGGFINVAKLSLIAGASGQGNPYASVDAAGRLNPFLITNANINIEGRDVTNRSGAVVAKNLGIDASGTDYLELIAQAIKINGDIIANPNGQVSLIAAEGSYDTKTGKIIENAEGANKQKSNAEYAIDSTIFGGIYAGRIKIIANADGIGTRIRSDLIANVDDIEFDVNGNLLIDKTNVQAKDEIKIKSAGDITINETQVLANGLNLQTNKNASIDKTKISANTIDLQSGKNITLNESLISSNKKINIQTANNTSINLTEIFSNIFQINAAQSLNLNKSQIIVYDKADIKAVDVNLLNETLFSGLNINIQAQRLNNAKTSKIESAKDLEIIGQKGIENLGSIRGGGNIVLQTESNFENKGWIESLSGLTFIEAKDITVRNTKEIRIAGYNISLNAKGKFTNETGSDLYARNDLTINGANIYNNGILKADKSINLYSLGEIINSQQASIAGLESIYGLAGIRIINYGKIDGGGVIDLKTESAINADYKLNDTNAAPAPKKRDVPDEVKEQLAKIDSINTIAGLSALLEWIEDEETFFAVQDKIRGLKIKQLLAIEEQKYNYSDEAFTIGGSVRIADGNNGITEIVVDEAFVQEKLQSILGANYKESDWELKIPEITQKDVELTQEQKDKIQEQIEAAQAEIEQRKAEIEAARAAGEEIEDFEISLDEEKYRQEMTEFFEYENYKAKEQELIVEAQGERLGKIENYFKTQKSKIDNANVDELNSLKAQEFKNAMIEIFANNFDENNFEVKVFNAQKSNVADNQYFAQLRIDNKNQTSLEKTGIHNYGRIYAGGDVILRSNSVIHNNKNIYAGSDINLFAADIIFNNSGGGTWANPNAVLDGGIIAGGGVNIGGVAADKTKQLINYDGQIRALSGDIKINALSVVNYGSDKANIYANAYAGASRKVKDNDMPKEGETPYVKLVYETYYIPTLQSNKSGIIAENGDVIINAGSDGKVVNYNAEIFGESGVKIKANSLVNAIAQFQVIHENEYYNRENYSLWERFQMLWEKGYEMLLHHIDYETVTLQTTDGKAKIVSGGTVEIEASSIVNGAPFGTKDANYA
ncbi:MAG: filamentous hemagglutinin N-terminal domain-containing protein, partial [Elusimicrobiota bacterium]|nr:filamentous hemagglutinin N-terminal domain-containing protein [Elusimicrobiota bacterium]